jgi:hypothetical protein
MKKDQDAPLMHKPKYKSSPNEETHYNNVIDQKSLLFPLVKTTTEVVPDHGHTQARDQVIRFDI